MCRLSRPSEPTLYWFYLGTTVPGRTRVNIFLSGTVMNIVKSHTDLANTDTMSTEGIVRVLPTNEIFLSSLYPLHEVVWTGFSLNDMMQPLIAFYVARFVPDRSTDKHNGLLAFNVILINKGDAWNPVTHNFRVSEAGIYVFSATMILLKKTIASCAHINLHKNLEVIQRSQSGITDLMTSGKDLLTLSHLTLLNMKDEIFLTAQAYSDLKDLQISFSGFLYSPRFAQRVRRFSRYFLNYFNKYIHSSIPMRLKKSAKYNRPK